MKDKVYKFNKIIENTVLHKFRTGDIIRKNGIYGDFKAINRVQKYGNRFLRKTFCKEIFIKDLKHYQQIIIVQLN